MNPSRRRKPAFVRDPTPLTRAIIHRRAPVPLSDMRFFANGYICKKTPPPMRARPKGAVERKASAKYSSLAEKISAFLLRGRIRSYIIFNRFRQENRLQSHAGVAELADAYGSGPYGGNPVKVQVLSPAPYECKPGICRVFCFQHSIAHSRNFAQTLLRRTSPQNLDIAARTLARTSCTHHVKHGKCNLRQ